MDCSICYEDLKDPTILSCNHSFCTGCISKWKSKTCPLCRVDTNHLYIPSSNITPSFTSTVTNNGFTLTIITIHGNLTLVNGENLLEINGDIYSIWRNDN